MTFITSYNPMPISFTHGNGAWLYDDSGKAYLDGLSGIAVCGLGHNHPEVTQTIQKQAEKLIHTSNAFIIKQQLQLAERLSDITGMSQFFIANSGAEANEAAIKISRLYGHQKGIENPCIIVMERAFHGRTMATLTASGSRKVQAGFEPLLPGFIRAPYNNFAAIERIAENRDDIVAIFLEPIQGEGGIHPAESAYLKQIDALCERKGWLFMLDEIQTGNGRTGNWYDFMNHTLRPDVVTTAKGLGNGMPVSACMMDKKAKNLLMPGTHGSTFGGNPLACATALTVLDVIEKENLNQRVIDGSKRLKDKLMQTIGSLPEVKCIRGKGYMLGIELDRSVAKAKQIGLDNGLLFNVTADSVIRLLPPLIMTDDEIDSLVDRLATTIETFLKQESTFEV